MSSKTPTAASKANGDAAKSVKTWTLEENTKLLLLIMQEENRELAVKGWKTIADKAQNVFGGKYTLSAVKHQFQKLRKQYIDEFPISENEEQANGEAAKAPAKGQKRAATSTDGPNTEGSAAPKTKKPRTSKKAAASTEALASETLQDGDGDFSGGDKQKSAKSVPKRRAVKGPKIKNEDDADGEGQDETEATAKPKPKKARVGRTQKKHSDSAEPAKSATQADSQIDDKSEGNQEDSAAENRPEDMETEP